MTSVTQGANITLVSQWYEYAGGAAVDLLTTPTIKVIRLADGAPIIAQTSTGVSHPATGVYTYVWAVAPSEEIGDYLATWNGTDAASGAVSASETVSVISGGGLTQTWATPAEASSITGEVITQAQLNVAYYVIETRAGVVTAAREKLTNRDLRELKKAEAYQAAWMAGQIALMSRSDADLVSQDGLQYSKGDVDMHILSPLAKAALSKLSWLRGRTINPLSASQALALRNKVYQETYGLYDADDEEYLGEGGKWVPM